MAGSVDDIVGTADEPEVAVFVHSRRVACDVPALLEPGVVHLEILPVLVEHGRPAGTNNQVAVLTRGHRVEVFVHDSKLHSGDGSAHRAGLDVH